MLHYILVIWDKYFRVFMKIYTILVSLWIFGIKMSWILCVYPLNKNRNLFQMMIKNGLFIIKKKKYWLFLVAIRIQFIYVNMIIYCPFIWDNNITKKHQKNSNHWSKSKKVSMDFEQCAPLDNFGEGVQNGP